MLNSHNYNPDVLTCLANLSSDEVFTPPKMANEILDLLPPEIWRDKGATFLDPACKSGVFLREIAKRLDVGLEKDVPNKQERSNHIFSKQLYGLAITELTSLLSRRSVYCSKTADGKYSVCETFNDPQGNIRFERVEHTWINGRCTFCGANKANYERGQELETHAYEFIHTDNPEEIFNMKFDVIVGNPPYQLDDGGAQKSASPIYNKFVEQAKKLNPRFLSMIIPARWYNGGKGLDEFRSNMLNDRRIAEIHDFPDTSDCFPGLNVRGGVCYFLWNSKHDGDCAITTHKGGVERKTVTRPLLEPGLEVFIRYNESISILKKVQSLKEEPFNINVSARKPFGLPTNYEAFKKTQNSPYDILLHRFGDNGYLKHDQVEKNHSLINKWKVLVPKASPGDDSYPHLILSKPIVAGPKTCCTETYIVVGPFSSKREANTVASYMVTSFFRFMVLLAKSTQDVTKKTYIFVPEQDFNEQWTDERLFAKYSFTKEEISFIDSLVRPMDVSYE